MSEVIIPKINPIRFVPENSTNTRSFDGALFADQIKSYQDKVYYAQPWAIGDPIRLQLRSDLAPVKLYLLDCAGVVKDSFDATAPTTDLYSTTSVVYEFSLPLDSGLIEGDVFSWRLAFGEGTGVEEYWKSEPQKVVEDNDLTMLWDFKNTRNTRGVYFKTGIKFSYRVESALTNIDPQSVDYLFADQFQTLRKLSSTPIVQWLFMISDQRGVPDWVIRLLNLIFGLDTVSAYGIQYTKPDGQKWAPVEVDKNYPLRGFTTILQEKINLDSVISQNNRSPAESIAVVFNINTDAFGDLNQPVSNNVIQVTKIIQ